MPERPLDRPIYPVVVPANQGRPRTPRGGSRLRLAGAATQTGFPEERETASEWDRGTHTCCFRRPSSSRSPERASASTAASRITTSPPVRKKTPCTRQSDCSPAGSAVRFGRVVCEVCCDMQKTRHRLVPGNKPPSPTYKTRARLKFRSRTQDNGSNVWEKPPAPIRSQVTGPNSEARLRHRPLSRKQGKRDRRKWGNPDPSPIWIDRIGSMQ